MPKHLPRPKPIPLVVTDLLPLSKASTLLGVSDDTLRRWSSDHEIGVLRRLNSWSRPKWFISLPAARMMAARDGLALDALREGDRTSELVRPYLHAT